MQIVVPPHDKYITTRMFEWNNYATGPQITDVYKKYIKEGLNTTSKYNPWLVILNYIKDNDFSPVFSIDNVIEAKLLNARHPEELEFLIDNLLKKSTYKKYNNVWNWIPQLQNILLDTNWRKKYNEKDTKLKAKPRFSDRIVHSTIDARHSTVSMLEDTLNRFRYGRTISSYTTDNILLGTAGRTVAADQIDPPTPIRDEEIIVQRTPPSITNADLLPEF